MKTINYYFSVIILCWLSLIVLSILVFENNRLTKKEKTSFYLTYTLVALAALMELLGIVFNGNSAIPEWVLRAVKCVDYMLTPIAGAALITNTNSNSIWTKIIKGVLAANVVFQLISYFTGWMLTIDSGEHYSHGPLYPAYMILYSVLIVFIAVEFITYGNKFRKQNRPALYSIIILVFISIMTQELLGGEYRTAYLGLTLGMIMMFIHITEFSQLATDDRIREQRVVITTDALTGASSRYAYAEALNNYDSAKELPVKLTVFSIDINGLKNVNDNLGHAAGDELICGAAECITKTFGSGTTCYRTGGDEFIVFSEMDKEEALKTLELLKQNASGWHGEKVGNLSLSAGYARAADFPELSAEKLVVEADMAMYEEKAAYYKDNQVGYRIFK
ncbi:MAG: GGDEF domain-containing protein [Ruminococcus sp.]|nr:GGDEF domain-containing protein [Ruminococcus sp.]